MPTIIDIETLNSSVELESLADRKKEMELRLAVNVLSKEELINADTGHCKSLKIRFSSSPFVTFIANPATATAFLGAAGLITTLNNALSTPIDLYDPSKGNAEWKAYAGTIGNVISIISGTIALASFGVKKYVTTPKADHLTRAIALAKLRYKMWINSGNNEIETALLPIDEDYQINALPVRDDATNSSDISINIVTRL